MNKRLLRIYRICFFVILSIIIGFGYKKKSILVFSVMGDVPRNTFEDTLIQKQIIAHNRYSPSEFMLHVGDIKGGKTPCTEDQYSKVAGYLKKLKVPTFIVPGDNEWNDCENPEQAWVYWTKHFLRFEDNWNHHYRVIRQDGRLENMAWIVKGVLMIGLNLQGGRIHNQAEWDNRHKECAAWIAKQLAKHKRSTRAAVIFFQAHPDAKHTLFMEPFRISVRKFEKPVLLIHGDGHRWLYDNPWLESNLVRVQVDKGLLAVPLEVTVTLNKKNMFIFNREPFKVDE